MEEFKNFIFENWKLLAAGGLFLFSIIISTIVVVKKSGGKMTVWEAMKNVLLEKIPNWITIVETDGNGEEKKNGVINLALKEAASVVGRKLSDQERDLVIALASKMIEEVLAAPQKKNLVAQRKGKYRV